MKTQSTSLHAWKWGPWRRPYWQVEESKTPPLLRIKNHQILVSLDGSGGLSVASKRREWVRRCRGRHSAYELTYLTHSNYIPVTPNFHTYTDNGIQSDFSLENSLVICLMREERIKRQASSCFDYRDSRPLSYIWEPWCRVRHLGSECLCPWWEEDVCCSASLARFMALLGCDLHHLEWFYYLYLVCRGSNGGSVM